MKKASVFTKSVIGLLVFYLLYTTAFVTYEVLDTYNVRVRRYIVNQTMYSMLGRALLKNGQLDELGDALNIALDENQIHFYLIRTGGLDYVYGNKNGDKDLVTIPQGFLEGTVVTDGYRFSILQEGSHELIVGHQVSKWAVLVTFLKDKHDVLFKDVFLVVLGIALLILYNLRDLRMLVRKFSEKGAKRGDEQLAKSKETLTLVRGLSGYESRLDALAKENEVFRGQVLPALKRELQSGKKPPYEFDCTLVRTDINNFTSVFASDKRAHFMGTINEFFVEVSHIVSRYNGSVYEFIGDEVLFYFKNDDHQNSAAIAIAALRDVNKFALELSERTEAEAGYQFRIKSSVAAGTLRFGPLVDGYSLAGPVLIETVRMLSHVHEKSENTILVDQSLVESIASLARTQAHQVVMLKGLQGSRHLHRIDQFTPLSLHLRQATAESLAYAHYYRHDSDLVQIMDFVETTLGMMTEGTLNKLLTNFRTFRITKASTEVRRAYLRLLNSLIQRAEHAGTDEAQYLLASTISAASHFFSEKEWTKDLRESFLQCLRLSNRRVVANALDVFAELEPQAAEDIFNELAGLNDNRIVANVLVKEGKREWGKAVAKKVEEMLTAKSPYFKASGLYALGEIAQHLKETDSAAYSADSRLEKLLHNVCELCFHPNAMVRRQALKAITKSDRVSTLAESVQKFAARASAEVIAEIKLFLEVDSALPQAKIATLSVRRSA